LRGGRVGQHSIRINDRWRICFVWIDRDAEDVEIVDYHQQLDKVDQVSKSPLAPVHAGEILREEFLVPLGVTAYALAAELQVPRTRIERLVREETPVTPDTALRLARYFGTTPEFWLGIQSRFDVETARQLVSDDIAAIKPRKSA
jgi:antitoxin HigA-1